MCHRPKFSHHTKFQLFQLFLMSGHVASIFQRSWNTPANIPNTTTTRTLQPLPAALVLVLDRITKIFFKRKIKSTSVQSFSLFHFQPNRSESLLAGSQIWRSALLWTLFQPWKQRQVLHAVEALENILQPSALLPTVHAWCSIILTVSAVCSLFRKLSCAQSYER